MCGLAGFFSTTAKQGLVEIARQMANEIGHRGPDDVGVWADAAAGLALGHRRLSIVDLSPAGHQPMLSASGRYVMVFNGEVYNHEALRGELGGRAWRGHSDTETLLAGFEAWGVEATLRKAVGMFAIALWDTQAHTLTLVRDRIGEKPLYYGWVGRGDERAFVFGSELKALRAYPGFDNPVCREALAQYMRLMYVPTPLSIYEGIYKLEPGCLLTVDRQVLSKTDVNITRWWSLAGAVEAGAQNPVGSDAEAVDLLEAQLGQAVQLQSLADVPLGAFLSGGVDSSAIVALMQKQSNRPVKTFTMGFDEAGFDEAPHARAVAQHLGTDHTEVRVSAQMAQDVIPGLPHMYDEPFADSSQIATYLVSQAARQHVTVALSGDAGDELFGGYNRYFWGPRVWNRLSWLPFALRQQLGRAVAAVPVGGWNTLSGVAGVARLGDKAHKLAKRLVTVQGMDDLYTSLVSEWEGQQIVIRSGDAGHGLSRLESLDYTPAGLGDVERMMYRDAVTYLPDDILCKVDRAAMACSLETRVPFLDHRVVELAWRMPLHMKVRGNVGKWALRQVLYRHVPRELIERPKAGFAVPVGQWLRGPLRDWAEDLLGAQRLQAEGYLHPAPIRQTWAEHLAGQRDHTARLWAVLMFQAWLAHQQG